VPVYRLGPRYLCYRSPERALVYDDTDGSVSEVVDVAAYLGDSARRWRIVFDHEPIPAALRARLVLPLKRPEG
jgi:hypothetical protein